MDCYVSDNSLLLPIGTRFSLYQLTYNFELRYYSIKQMKIQNKVEGVQSSGIIALFDQNDVDFEVVCDNQLCARGIKLTLSLDGMSELYYIPPKTKCTLQEMVSHNKKLHFLTLWMDTDDMFKGHSSKPKTYDKNTTLTAINCPKLVFSIEVEREIVTIATTASTPIPTTLQLAALPLIDLRFQDADKPEDTQKKKSITLFYRVIPPLPPITSPKKLAAPSGSSSGNSGSGTSQLLTDNRLGAAADVFSDFNPDYQIIMKPFVVDLRID